MIRWMTERDDLKLLLGREYDDCQWNPRQVLVAERHGELVGCVVLWDGGHSILRADCLTVRPDCQHLGIGVRLAAAVWQYAQEHQRAFIACNVTNMESGYAMQRLGGVNAGTIHTMWFTVRPGPLVLKSKEAW